jgi:hypothetical protein
VIQTGTKGTSGETLNESKSGVTKNYRIAYQRRIYVNIPFELSILFTSQRLVPPDVTGYQTREGHICISHTPADIMVELQFTEGSFEADRKSVKVSLNEKNDTTLSFWLKPLKSEDCLLSVRICQVEEGNPAPKVTELDWVALHIAVTSVLGLNAHNLDLALKGLGSLISLCLIALAYITKREVDWVQLTGMVFLALATPFGVTVAGSATDLLKPQAAKVDDC